MTLLEKVPHKCVNRSDSDQNLGNLKKKVKNLPSELMCKLISKYSALDISNADI